MKNVLNLEKIILVPDPGDTVTKHRISDSDKKNAALPVPILFTFLKGQISFLVAYCTLITGIMSNVCGCSKN
jgi:hypothetical protein